MENKLDVINKLIESKNMHQRLKINYGFDYQTHNYS